MAGKRQNGPWEGFITENRKKKFIYAMVNYSSASHFSGEGVDEKRGNFHLNGDIILSPPFAATLTLTYETGEPKTVSYDGYREGSTGGFGNPSVSLTPATPDRAEFVRKKVDAAPTPTEKLLGMGFNIEDIQRALAHTDGDFTSALDLLGSTAFHAGDGPTDVGAQTVSGGPPSEAVQTLMELGFTSDQVKEALTVCDNNVELASEYLLNSLT